MADPLAIRGFETALAEALFREATAREQVEAAPGDVAARDALHRAEAELAQAKEALRRAVLEK